MKKKIFKETLHGRLGEKSDMHDSDIEEDVLQERRRVTVQRHDVTLDDTTSRSDVLEIVGLTKTFNSLTRRTEVVAVNDVTLGIHRGEVCICRRGFRKCLRISGVYFYIRKFLGTTVGWF